jgi:hypothetical protein
MSARNDTPLLLAPLLPLHGGAANLEAEALNNRMCVAPCSGGHGGGWAGLLHHATPQQHFQNVSTRHSAGRTCLLPRRSDRGPPTCAAYLPKRGRAHSVLPHPDFAYLALLRTEMCPKGPSTPPRQGSAALFSFTGTSLGEMQSHGVCGMRRWRSIISPPPRASSTTHLRPLSRSTRRARMRARRTACQTAHAHPHYASLRHSQVHLQALENPLHLGPRLRVTAQTCTQPPYLHCDRPRCS